jgi:anti-sigma factor RsiW
MSHPKTEWLAALADGELRGWRRWLVARHAQNCPTCAAEYRHQRHVREMLRQNPRPVEMNESAEFFWSKVRGEIQRQQPQPVAAPVRPVVVEWLLQYRLQVATVVAAIMIAVGLFWIGTVRPGAKIVATAAAEVQHARAPIEDSVATVLPTEQANVAVVWISGLPWTKDMDEMMTVFANLDS